MSGGPTFHAGHVLWLKIRRFAAENLTLPDPRDARITSLQASLDDAHREVSRLTGEKHARDQVIHEIAEKAASLHRQEAGK